MLQTCMLETGEEVQKDLGMERNFVYNIYRDSNRILEGTVQRDFRHKVFFIIQTSLGH